MIRQKIIHGQTIYDLAIILTGSVEGLFLLLNENPSLNLIDQPVPGTEVVFSGTPVNQSVVDYFKNQKIQVASYTLITYPIITTDQDVYTVDNNIITSDNG